MDKLNFWKPQNSGDTVKGIFGGAFEFGLSNAIKLIDKATNADTFVNLTLIIAICLKREPPKIGDEVGIIYNGTEKRTKLYDVYINGKLIDRNAPVDLEKALNHSIDQGRQKK